MDNDNFDKDIVQISDKEILDTITGLCTDYIDNASKELSHLYPSGSQVHSILISCFTGLFAQAYGVDSALLLLENQVKLLESYHFKIDPSKLN